MAEVIGIPNMEDLGDLSKMKPGTIGTYIVQRHQAQRAGLHYDHRVGTPEHGLYSWASRSGPTDLNDQEMMGAFQQPLHTWDYKDFSGTIDDGYGAGRVDKVFEQPVLITENAPGKLLFSTAGKYPQRYVMIQPDPLKPWMIRQGKMPQAPETTKDKYKDINRNDAERFLSRLPKGSVVQPKVDGALVFIQSETGRPELISHRISRKTGLPVVHTERFFGHLPAKQDEWKGTVVKGEVFGERDGVAIHPSELSGILNSSLEKSLRDQQERKVRLKTMLFDVVRYKGQDVSSLPYMDRMKIVQALAKTQPGKFLAAPTATTKEDGLALWRQIREGRYPMTKEGVVVRGPRGELSRIKSFDEDDVYIRDTFPATPGSKYDKLGIPGGFTYSFEPEGDVVGRVGTGFDDELRSMLPDLIGRKARIQHIGSSGGALQKPSLIAIHEGWPGPEDVEPKQEEGTLVPVSAVNGPTVPSIPGTGLNGLRAMFGLPKSAGLWTKSKGDVPMPELMRPHKGKFPKVPHTQKAPEWESGLPKQSHYFTANVLTGAGVGAGLGALLSGLQLNKAKNEDPNLPDSEKTKPHWLRNILIGAGLGAGTGAAKVVIHEAIPQIAGLTRTIKEMNDRPLEADALLPLSATSGSPDKVLGILSESTRPVGEFAELSRDAWGIGKNLPPMMESIKAKGPKFVGLNGRDDPNRYYRYIGAVAPAAFKVPAYGTEAILRGEIAKAQSYAKEHGINFGYENIFQKVPIFAGNGEDIPHQLEERAGSWGKMRNIYDALHGMFASAARVPDPGEKYQAHVLLNEGHLNAVPVGSVGATSRSDVDKIMDAQYWGRANGLMPVDLPSNTNPGSQTWRIRPTATNILNHELTHVWQFPGLLQMFGAKANSTMFNSSNWTLSHFSRPGELAGWASRLQEDLFHLKGKRLETPEEVRTFFHGIMSIKDKGEFEKALNPLSMDVRRLFRHLRNLEENGTSDQKKKIWDFLYKMTPALVQNSSKALEDAGKTANLWVPTVGGAVVGGGVATALVAIQKLRNKLYGRPKDDGERWDPSWAKTIAAGTAAGAARGLVLGLGHKAINSIAEAGSKMAGAKPPAVKELLVAKSHSDQKNYGAKHRIVRKMMEKSPDSFTIDSEENGIVGITHSSGFKMHVPKQVVPEGVKKAADVVVSGKPNDFDVKHHVLEAQRARVNTSPTAAQAEAGNYRKGHVRIQGLDISIENPKGSYREGIDRDGTKWQTKMRTDYGYIKGTVSGADDDHIDVLLGPDLDSEVVYVIDQYIDGKFDEHKCAIGFKTSLAAKEGYLSNYAVGWKGFGGLTMMTMEQFKWWIMNGDSSKPVKAQQTPKFAEDFEKWIGFDLDGTLAKSPKGTFDPEVVGEPVKSVLALAKGFIRNGEVVKIFTARAADPQNIAVVERWCREHGLGDVEVTNEKDPGCILIVDDRAIHAAKNRGLTAEDKSLAKSIVKGAGLLVEGDMRARARKAVSERGLDPDDPESYKLCLQEPTTNWQQISSKLAVRLEGDDWKVYDENNQSVEKEAAVESPETGAAVCVGMLGTDTHPTIAYLTDLVHRTDNSKSAVGLLRRPIEPAVEYSSSGYGEVDVGALTEKVAADMRGLMPARQLTDEDKTELVSHMLARSVIDPEISERTLGAPIGNLGKDAFLATSKKLLAINRGEAKPDDRDHKANQTYHSVEDFMAERVAKDADGIGRTLLMRVRYNGTLEPLRPGLFTKQLEKLIVSNSLSQAVPGINPIELVDIQQKITQVGEGGIGSRDSVPMESRNVHPSQLGVVDPIRTAESGAVGIDQRLSSFARKGPNQQLYMPLIDRKTGKRVWRTPSQLYGKTILFPAQTTLN